MSDISTFTGKFRAHKGSSYKLSTGGVTKRPRDSLVCSPCRNSKLRCDRGQPCTSCIKRDEAAACTYQRATGLVADNSLHAVAEDRLLHLESMVKELMQNQPSTRAGTYPISAKILAPPDLPRHLAETADQPRSAQVDDSARYVGSTHWSAILEDLQELKVVLGGSAGAQESEDPIQPEAPALGSELIFGSSHDYSLQQILSEYLPSKVEAVQGHVLAQGQVIK